jgi:uncharacterized membrane protein YfcA
MNFFSLSAAGFFAGLLGALGLGGGGVLVIFLTVFMHVPQLKAQGINLLFFIPTGVFALIFHLRRGLADMRAALPAAGLGLIGAALGSLAARFIGAEAVRIIFGLMLAALGGWELFAPRGKSGAARAFRASRRPPRR